MNCHEQQQTGRGKTCTLGGGANAFAVLPGPGQDRGSRAAHQIADGGRRASGAPGFREQRGAFLAVSGGELSPGGNSERLTVRQVRDYAPMCAAPTEIDGWAISPLSCALPGGHGPTMDPMIKLVGVIQPMEQKSIRAEGDTYEDARAALTTSIPEGWRLVSLLNES